METARESKRMDEYGCKKLVPKVKGVCNQAVSFVLGGFYDAEQRQ
jgi:hypothetical protein